MGWFLYDRDFRHERVNIVNKSRLVDAMLPIMAKPTWRYLYVKVS